MKPLDSTKSHGYGNISIRMIKICSELVIIPLKIIFKESLKKGIFAEIWKISVLLLYFLFLVKHLKG